MRILTKTAAAVLLAAGFLAGPAALADPTYPPVAPTGAGVPFTGGGGGESFHVPEVVVPEVVPETGGGGLPMTGQDIGLLALVGGAALATGAGVVVALRRPRAASAARAPQGDQPIH